MEVASVDLNNLGLAPRVFIRISFSRRLPVRCSYGSRIASVILPRSAIQNEDTNGMVCPETLLKAHRSTFRCPRSLFLREA